MKTCLRLFFTASIALLFSSCGNIRLTEPLADRTSPEIQETLTGNWSADGDVIQIAFDEKGQGQLAYIERKDETFQFGRGELAAVTRGDRHFLSIRVEEEGKLLDYLLFAEYTIAEDDTLIIWPPEEEVFEKAIASKALDGIVTKQERSVTILISSPAANVLDFFEKHPEAFDTREPILYRKLK